MSRPITKSQFSNNVLVSGEGKPLTEHQETHLMERHAYRFNGTAMNEKGLGRLAGFIAVGWCLIGGPTDHTTLTRAQDESGLVETQIV